MSALSAFRFVPLYVTLVGQAYHSPSTERIPGELVLFARERQYPYGANAIAVSNTLHGCHDKKIGYVQARPPVPPPSVLIPPRKKVRFLGRMYTLDCGVVIIICILLF